MLIIFIGTIEEQRFISLVSHFVNAINTGCVDLQHGRILLSHYGYLGPSYDAVCREYIKMLRSETLQNKNGEVLVAAVIDCIQEVLVMNSSPYSAQIILYSVIQPRS